MVLGTDAFLSLGRTAAATLGLPHLPVVTVSHPEDLVGLATTADDVMVVVAGRPGKHSAIVPTFGATRSVTVRIEE